MTRTAAGLVILRSVSYIATLFAVFAFGLSYLITDGDGYHAMDSGEQELIALASAFVEQSRSEKDRLPTQNEFSAWSEAMDDKGYRYGGQGFTYAAAPFFRARSQSLTACFGESPARSFAFFFWTGDNWVSVASWGQSGSLACIAESDYLFGKRGAAPYVFAIAGVILLILAIWLHLVSERPRKG
jgi:hypothetical protein